MAIARVSFTEGTNGSSTTAEVTVPNASAGDTILFLIDWHAVVTVSSITCSGETVVLHGSPHTGGPNNGRMQWAYIAEVASGGNKTTSVTWSGGPSAGVVKAWRLTGVDTTTPIDAASVSATASTANPTVNITTASANAAIFSALNSQTGDPSDVQSGFTPEPMADIFWYNHGQYNVDVGAAGTKAVGYTLGAGQYVTSAIALKQAGGGGPAIPVLASNYYF